MNKRSLLWGGYLALVHLALVAVLLKPQGFAWWMARATNKAPGTDLIQTMRGVHRQMDASVPAGATIFLGDSITMALATSAVAPVSVNYGIGWQRSDQLLDSMEIYRSMQRAAAVVIMIGTNDILQGRQAGLDARYRAILAKVPAGVPVVLVGVPPLASADVRTAGAAAQRACVADPRCAFLDASAAVTPDMLLPDGVHLSPAAYAALVPLEREALKKNAPGLSAPRA